MSDFLAVFGRRIPAAGLLELIRKPYEGEPRPGEGVDYPWGSLAILNEPFSPSPSLRRSGGQLFGWIGDLLNARDERFISKFMAALAGSTTRVCSLASDLNGAFALCHADDRGLTVVTDIGSFTPVYVATDPATGTVRAIGSHPDLVAVAGHDNPLPDLVSLAHFLDYGYSGLSASMHQDVSVLRHASVHVLAAKPGGLPELETIPYWREPEEESGRSERDFAAELRELVTTAVRDRCFGEKIAVCLSGGLDSRAILAAVPPETDCTGVTFFDSFNREAATARAVAEAFHRKWLPLARDEAFLSCQIGPVVAFSGCEGEWVTAHEIGFAKRLREERFDTILHGLNFDSFLKGFTAKKLARRKRLGGLLPPGWKKELPDFASAPNKFLTRQVVHGTFRHEVVSRRQSWRDERDERSPISALDLQGSFPGLRRCCANWDVERRVIPLRMPALDRRIIDFMHRCPIEFRVGGRLLERAMKGSLAPARHIPNANTGVRIGASRPAALLQRAIRLASERSERLRKRSGEKPKVEHSWHDYAHYWSASPHLRQLVLNHGEQLDSLFPELFVEHPASLLAAPDLHWTSGFRLVHLACWLDRVAGYRRDFGELLRRVPAAASPVAMPAA